MFRVGVGGSYSICEGAFSAPKRLLTSFWASSWIASSPSESEDSEELSEDSEDEDDDPPPMVASSCRGGKSVVSLVWGELRGSQGRGFEHQST